MGDSFAKLLAAGSLELRTAGELIKAIEGAVFHLTGDDLRMRFAGAGARPAMDPASCTSSTARTSG